MKFPESTQVRECGVDWITLTAKDHTLAGTLTDVGTQLLEECRALGDEVSPFNWKGFEGWCVRGVEVATRYDCSMVRLHGREANDHWTKLSPHAQNCSRIDLQTTLSVEGEEVDHLLARIHRAVQRKKLHGKKLQWHYRRDSSRGNTVEVGRRPSQKFGRIYNKHFESKLDHYRGCARLEAELKGDEAYRVWRSLSRSPRAMLWTAGYLHTFFSDRAVEFGIPREFCHLIECLPQARDSERKLEWLRKSVRPSVIKWIRSHDVAQVVEALGLTDYVDVKTTGPRGP